MELCIVMSGNLSGGYRAYGPFESLDAARNWYADSGLSSEESYIMDLYVPAECDKNLAIV
jgi:hypothetical protein